MVLTYDAYLGARDSGLVKQLEDAGVPSIVIDFRQYPLENTVPSINLMGRVLGQEERAQKLADFYTTNVNLVYSRIEKLDEKTAKPSVFLYRAPGFGDCCGTFGSANMGLLIERAGGKNIGSELLPGWSGTVSPEQVIASDPDVIIVTASNWKNSLDPGRYVSAGYNTTEATARDQLQALIDKTPGWDTLSATKNGRVHAIWHQFYISPYQFVPLLQFAKWQYPEVFTDIDPNAVFKQFHEEFLPIDYSGTFTVGLR
jgi:iron complex transport system substrate-binding protein